MVQCGELQGVSHEENGRVIEYPVENSFFGLDLNRKACTKGRQQLEGLLECV